MCSKSQKEQKKVYITEFLYGAYVSAFAQELCAPCGLQQNNKVDFSASNLACLSKLHFCQTNTH